jgi:SAM-dependent methyltransferase
VNLNDVFDLGDQPLANSYLTREQLSQPETRFPLVLRECADCGMIQLKHVVDASSMFIDYAFMTGSSQGMASHFAELMRENVTRYVPYNGLVVEIGSNDGTALASIPNDGRCRRLGIDPAKNLATIAHSRNVPYISEFFTESLSDQIIESHGQASLIVACNVLGHIDDLDDVLRGVRHLLTPEGAFVAEVPYVGWLVSRTEYDTIYHEHLSYFGIRPIEKLAERHGMRVTRVETQDVHGGSIRVTMQHVASPAVAATPLIHGELPTLDWHAFRKRCEETREQLVGWLTRARDEGRTVAGYGCPAKATVRLNYCGIGTDLMPFLVDSTPVKQNHFVPGTRQPIHDPSVIDELNPSDVLILAWNHNLEIRSKLNRYVAGGGRVASLTTTGRLNHA